MFVALKQLKTSIETLKWKFDQIWTTILCDIDVDLASMCWKKHIVYKNNYTKNLHVPCGYIQVLA